MSKFLILIGLIFSSLSLNAQQWAKTYEVASYIGPEWCYVKRHKKGGAEQTGNLYGVRLGLDRIKRCKIYWGAEGLYETGILTGHIDGNCLKSRLTDYNIEGRLGYTFQSKYWHCASITPFVGLGYFWEHNCYQHPSPLKVHLKNQFGYVPFGFLSQVFVTPKWSIGLNVKIRWLWEGNQDVSHDPDFDNTTQKYTEKVQYRLELPITYFFCLKQQSLAFAFEPFYENRCYGHRVNFPFDFMETTFNFYGLTLKLFYLF